MSDLFIDNALGVADLLQAVITIRVQQKYFIHEAGEIGYGEFRWQGIGATISINDTRTEKSRD